ncbi:hypothetical protein MAR_032459 [Mya arenaria]|uniref:Uncharacterized protein n=1 Tax=Mya arenaria TaxID=6604 RepID=A0ABY7F6U6_MYAAR|nr:hypothetical protein MAR_032459 [Mya arenaria]
MERKQLFPNTGFSADHTSGWNATHKLAKEAGVKRLDLVNATKQRHRISTLYCALEIPEKERQYFYKHMGHTKKVNWGTYQYPLPIMEITKVGKHLQDIDKGTMKHTNSSHSLSNEHILAHQPANEDDQSEAADKDSRSDELMLANQSADEDDQSESADKDSRSDEHMRAHQPADEDDQSEPADNAKNSDANTYKGAHLLKD